MSICFDNESHVTISLGDMIHLYQELAQARVSEDWAKVSLVLDRIQRMIDEDSICSTEINFRPSISSVVIPGHGIAYQDGLDIPCAFGHAVSYAREGGEDHCPETCPHRKSHECVPEYGKTLLDRKFSGTVERIQRELNQEA